MDETIYVTSISPRLTCCSTYLSYLGRSQMLQVWLHFYCAQISPDLSLVSKVLERFMRTKVSLSTIYSQFRSCFSTQEPLLSVTNYLHNLLSSTHCHLFFYMKKACESMPPTIHIILIIQSLSNLGIPGLFLCLDMVC